MHSRLSRPALPLILIALAGLALLVPGSSHTVVPARAEPRVEAAHNDTTTPFNLVSLPALIEHEYDGRELRLDHVLAQELAFTRYHLTYRSGSLRISGIMNVPNRPGRFPLLVLAHGYQSPAGYDSGDGLQREQAYLAASGYVVLQPDYRNYAGSDRERAVTVRRPLGYPEDLVNAVLAVRRAHLPFVDASRVGVVGRSMGGGVALNAVTAKPGLVDAVLLYSPVSSLAADNFEHWVRGNDALEAKVVAAYGAPRDAPAFWREASARSYLGRVDVPVQIHHGTADTTCPAEWSEATAEALRAAGKDVELFEYPGEHHRFEAAWPTLMRRTVDFFDQHV